MLNVLPLPKRYYHNEFWLSRYGAVDMLLYLWVFDKCPYCYKRKLCGQKTSPVIACLHKNRKDLIRKVSSLFYGADVHIGFGEIQFYR